MWAGDEGQPTFPEVPSPRGGADLCILPTQEALWAPWHSQPAQEHWELLGRPAAMENKDWKDEGFQFLGMSLKPFLSLDHHLLYVNGYSRFCLPLGSTLQAPLEMCPWNKLEDFSCIKLLLNMSPSLSFSHSSPFKVSQRGIFTLQC